MAKRNPGRRLKLAVDADHAVSAIHLAPRGAIACYVLAHGAGAGMSHPFMEAVAQGLAARKVATLRYQFPYMESGSRRPDRPALAQAAVAAAVRKAAALAPRLPLIAGGKSFGGRMTSQAQAREALPNVRGLAFLGFPLHLPNKPSTERAAHLAEVQLPLLFIQGDRDALADMRLLRSMTRRLGARATVHAIAGADHAFGVLVRSGRTHADALEEVVATLAQWITQLLAT